MAPARHLKTVWNPSYADGGMVDLPLITKRFRVGYFDTLVQENWIVKQPEELICGHVEVLRHHASQSCDL